MVEVKAEEPTRAAEVAAEGEVVEKQSEPLIHAGLEIFGYFLD